MYTYSTLDVLFPIVFIFIIVVIIVTVAKKIGTWSKNNNSPRITVQAKLVTKRQNTTYSTHSNGGDITGAPGVYTVANTQYYVTFQVESGDRIEMSVSSSEYGMLAEGDEGKLTFQGTRYISFEREV